jgi:hypothetical protein
MRSIYLFLILSCNAWGYELAIVTQFKDEAPYLKEWIEYHRMVGVDHFFLYNNSSTDCWGEVLKPYIDEGLVEVFHWPSETAEHLPRLLEAYKHAIRRARGNTKWVALIDLDEFILPADEKTIVECLNKNFSDAAAVYVNWLVFGTSGVYLSPDEPLIPNLIECSLKETNPMNNVGKTIVRPERVMVDAIDYAHCVPVLFEGSGYYNGNGQKMNYWSGPLRVVYHAYRFLRINHYRLRDENFFQNTRLVEGKKGYFLGREYLLELNRECSMAKNYEIIEFIMKNYPDKYEKFWKKKS